MGADLELDASEYWLRKADKMLAQQPKNRTECPPDDVPCPFVLCRYALWTDRVKGRRGQVIDILPTRTWGDRKHTCALREAYTERTLEEIGAACHFTRERTRQVEGAILRKRLKDDDLVLLRSYLDFLRAIVEPDDPDMYAMHTWTEEIR
jgi:hypothetical protein